MPDEFGHRVTTALRAGGLALLLVGGATIGFHDLFIGNGWVAPVAVAIVGGVTLTVLWRLLELPTWLGLGLTTGLGALWVLAWFPLAAGLAWSQRPAAAWDGLRLARMEIAQQVAPTPVLTGMSLLLVVGSFVVAVVVTELLARNLALSAIMASVVLWVAPLTIAIPERSLVVSTLAFALPAVAVLALVDDPVIGRAGQPWRRRMAGMAVALGIAVLAVPIAVRTPGHGSAPVFDLQGWGTTIQGYEPIVDVGDQLRLPSPRVVMEVETTRPAYLRTAALEVFDGRRWRVGQSLEQTQIPDSAYEDPTNGIGNRGAAASNYAIDVVNLPNVYLPVPNQPVAVSPLQGPAELTYSNVGEFVATDSMTALSEAIPNGPDYVVEADIPSPSYDDLAGAQVVTEPTDLNVQLPIDEPDLAALAQDVVTEAGARSTIDRVLAIQDHFAGPDSAFTYSTDVPELAGDTALRDFVLATQTGYCEYFATAMAVMLRSLDIPTRVATGYLPGEEVRPAETGEPGLYQVSTTDAHAWVEVRFPDQGWLTFDPTPRSDTAGLRPDSDDLSPFAPLRGDGQPLDDPRGFTGENNVNNPAPPSEGVQLGNQGGLPGTVGAASAGVRVLPWIVAGLLVLVGLALAAGWWWSRRVPDADDPDQSGLLALSHLLVSAAALGHGRRPDETLHEVTGRWVGQQGIRPDDAHTIADIGSRAAFGSTISADEAGQLRTTCERVGAQLRGQATMADRILATPRRITAKP